MRCTDRCPLFLLKINHFGYWSYLIILKLTVISCWFIHSLYEQEPDALGKLVKRMPFFKFVKVSFFASWLRDSITCNLLLPKPVHRSGFHFNIELFSPPNITNQQPLTKHSLCSSRVWTWAAWPRASCNMWLWFKVSPEMGRERP